VSAADMLAVNCSSERVRFARIFGGLLHRGRRTGVQPLKLVIFFTEYSVFFSDILTAFCILATQR